MKFSQMKAPSKYLAKEDIDPKKLVTIRGYVLENVAPMGKPPEQKWVLYFNEFQKGMVLNTTNRKLLEMATGSDDTDHTVGMKIVVFNDPSVQDLTGNLVGGIRIRKYNPRPENGAAIATHPQQPPVKAWPAASQSAQLPTREPGSDDDFNDEINF